MKEENEWDVCLGKALVFPLPIEERDTKLKPVKSVSNPK